MELKCLAKDARILIGMSQSELARKIGVSREQVNRIENYKIKNPGIITCKKISEALFTPIDMLWVWKKG